MSTSRPNYRDLAKKHGALSSTPPELNPAISAVGQKFARYAPYLHNVVIQPLQQQRDDRQVEFFPPWEKDNPNPGKLTLQPFRKELTTGPELTNAVAGELLHYIGGVDPRSGKPIDAAYQKLKQAVAGARTPHQMEVDKAAYAEAVKRGEKRPFEQWFNQSRLDEYIMGYVTPDKSDEWRKNGWYKDPAMSKAVENIKSYLQGPEQTGGTKQGPSELKAVASGLHESAGAYIPPAIQRIEDAVGMQMRMAPSLGDAIATVGKHEPHVIEINDPKRFAQGPKQTVGHEVVHLWFSNLAGAIQKQVPPDDPNHPYDISNVDALRKSGKKLWNLPQEQAATIVQLYVADPSQRKRLQPWIDDMNMSPLSVMNPTSPGDKGINITPRIPVPPVESYNYLEDLKKQAQQLKPTMIK